MAPLTLSAILLSLRNKNVKHCKNYSNKDFRPEPDTISWVKIGGKHAGPACARIRKAPREAFIQADVAASGAFVRPPPRHGRDAIRLDRPGERRRSRARQSKA